MTKQAKITIFFCRDTPIYEVYLDREQVEGKLCLTALWKQNNKEMLKTL